MGPTWQRDCAAVGSMAAATFAAAAAWSSTGGSNAFTLVGSEAFPQGRVAPRSLVPSQPGPPQQKPAEGCAGWPRLAAVAGALVAATRTAGRRRIPTSNSRTNGALAGSIPQQVQAHLSAARGDASAATTGRGARIVVKNGGKTKRGRYAIYRRKEMWLNHSAHMAGRPRKQHRLARQAVMQAFKNKYKSRRLFKRDRRTLWIMRVSANCELHGIKYSWLICKMKEANININRKILSQLGVYDRAVFTNIVDLAMPEWRRVKKNRFQKPADYTVEQLDDIMIPFLEKSVPELYTDEHIRFNRQVKGNRIQYTVDMGKPEEWREMLPKMPELANFNLPDHWTVNPNAEDEIFPVDWIPTPPDQESKDYIKFRALVEREQELDKEKEERGEPTWPKKTGVSRKDWFAEEPQSWF